MTNHDKASVHLSNHGPTQRANAHPNPRLHHSRRDGTGQSGEHCKPWPIGYFEGALPHLVEIRLSCMLHLIKQAGRWGNQFAEAIATFSLVPCCCCCCWRMQPIFLDKTSGFQPPSRDSPRVAGHNFLDPVFLQRQSLCRLGHK